MCETFKTAIHLPMKVEKGWGCETDSAFRGKINSLAGPFLCCEMVEDGAGR